MTDGASPNYVITGPTGWIGRAALYHLVDTLGPEWARRVQAFGSQARTLELPGAGALEVRALSDLSAKDVDGAIVLHLAYLTQEKAGPLGASAFFSTNLAIDDAVASACREGRAKGVFVASSGAAGAAGDPSGRTLYGVTKLLQEDRFLKLGRETGTPTLVGRIYNISGPHINKIDSYALSSMIGMALRGEDLVINAGIPVYRSYLHVEDLVRLVLAQLSSGEDAPSSPIDLCGPLVVEMEDLARAVVAATGLPDSHPILRGKVDCNRPNVYVGDATAARGLALRHGLRLKDFETQVADTVAFLQHNFSNDATRQ
jgi:nucleoside-diphosphate-sugar epimerase